MASEKSDVPYNLGGEGFMEIQELHFGSWTPLPNGEGTPTQVHMIIRLKAAGTTPLIMRFKSGRGLDEVIDALIDHRQDVFGPRKRSSPR